MKRFAAFVSLFLFTAHPSLFCEEEAIAQEENDESESQKNKKLPKIPFNEFSSYQLMTAFKEEHSRFNRTIIDTFEIQFEEFINEIYEEYEKNPEEIEDFLIEFYQLHGFENKICKQTVLILETLHKAYDDFLNQSFVNKYFLSWAQNPFREALDKCGKTYKSLVMSLCKKLKRANEFLSDLLQHDQFDSPLKRLFEKNLYLHKLILKRFEIDLQRHKRFKKQ